MNRTLISLLLLVPIMTFSNAFAESEFASATIGVGVVVSDLERSVDFYTNVIGMKKTGQFDIDTDFGKKSGLTNGVAFHVEVLKLEDSPEATTWKLMSFGKGPGHPRSKGIQDDLGMQYITINVASLQPFLERIKRHNVKLLGGTPIPLDTNRHFALVQDPDGTFIELIGPPK